VRADEAVLLPLQLLARLLGEHGTANQRED
jgi:hypothetical protein